MTLVMKCDNCGTYSMEDLNKKEPYVEKCPVCGTYMTLLKVLYKSKKEISTDELLDIINYVDDEEYEQDEENDSAENEFDVDRVEYDEDPCEDCDNRDDCLGSAIDCEGTPEECAECGVNQDCFCRAGSKGAVNSDNNGISQDINSDMNYINEIMSSYEDDESAALVCLKKKNNIIVEIVGEDPEVFTTLQTALMSVIIDHKMDKQEVESFMKKVTEEVIATMEENKDEE